MALSSITRDSSSITLTSAPVVTSPSVTPILLPPSHKYDHKDTCDLGGPTQRAQDLIPTSESLAHHIGNVPFAM